jgi:hypothetical protein
MVTTTGSVMCKCFVTVHVYGSDFHSQAFIVLMHDKTLYSEYKHYLLFKILVTTCPDIGEDGTHILGEELVICHQIFRKDLS